MKTCAKSMVQNVGQIAYELGMLARQSMLEEVYTTPKPGLVDYYSNGAHTDMDLASFQSSAEAITPFFIQMAEVGACAFDLNAEVFAEIRKIGLKAEKAMYWATGGVNTHKGMIFSLGIFATVAAFCRANGYMMTEKTLFFLEQKLTIDTLSEELKQIEKKEHFPTKGEQLYKDLGITGIRGEAIRGYESIRNIALPVLEEGLHKRKEYNLVKLQVLFALMSKVEDSNVAARKGKEKLKEVQICAQQFLKEGGAYQKDAIQKLRQLDAAFIIENVSCGGCADLMAVAIFIHNVIHFYRRG